MKSRLIVAVVLAWVLPTPVARAQDFLTLRGPGTAIGVSVREMTAAETAAAKLPDQGGVAIARVRPETPAARAGFEAGDIVVTFDGERVRGVRGFTRLVRETPPERTVTAIVVRAGTERAIRVTPTLESGTEGRSPAAGDARLTPPMTRFQG